MKKLVLEQEGNWVRLKGAYSKPFVDFIKTGVRPVAYRDFDAESKLWRVYWSQLPLVVHAGKKYFDHVDWSSLPEKWQMYAAGAHVPQAETSLASESPFGVLFLTEDAPMEVVKASYRALSLMYHPDHHG